MSQHQIKGITVSKGQADVYDVLRRYGPLPDHALVPLAQHVTQVHQSSSSIRTRRHELAVVGLVRPHGMIRTSANRPAQIWKVA